MSVTLLNSKPLSTMPWQDRPALIRPGRREVVWRDSRNPIITRDWLPMSNSIMNSAVVPFGDAFAGVFRVDDVTRRQFLHVGHSKDAIHWIIDENPIQFEGGLPFEYGYDPRVVPFGDEFIVLWCNGYQGQPTIGIAVTKEFKTFRQYENAFLPFNRNGVLFPRKINGKYMMLSRPSDPGHTPFGDIYVSSSPDLHYWGDHRLVMRRKGGWESTKIGAGPVPIETSEGWLLFYHGVLTSCNGFTYSFGGALLDLDDPTQVIARGEGYMMSPQTLYECVGDTSNVVFPCAALADSATGRIAIYYGAADTCVGVCYGYVDEIVTFIRNGKV